MHSLQSGESRIRRSNQRQSSFNTVSWTDQVDYSLSCGPSRPLSYNLEPLDITQKKFAQDLLEDVVQDTRKQIDLGGKQSNGPEEISRSSWTRRRPHSLQLNGEFDCKDSMYLSDTDRSVMSHQECNVLCLS